MPNDTYTTEEFIAEQKEYLRRRRARHRRWRGILAVSGLFLLIALCCLIVVLLLPDTDKGSVDEKDDFIFDISGKKYNNTHNISVPDWIVQDFLPKNPYSRPGTALKQVNGVVVHYVGNPGTTAEQNRSYFANLAETHDTYASSHFIIGIDGKIIQCVPLDEISYCSNDRNADTIAIECCHPDETGQFSEKTLSSLKKLVLWLSETYSLEKEDIIRHYDVSGKICPKYFAENPAEWTKFLDNAFSEKEEP